MDRPRSYPPPPTLWVEWHFRSNHPIPPNFCGCDAHFTVDYQEVHEWVSMYGDIVLSASCDYFVDGLDMNEFHTNRFESLDGRYFRFSVDGKVFNTSHDSEGNSVHYLQFGGGGGCVAGAVVNEWDFIRFGTISEGELLIASDPPGGYLDPDDYPALDRFTVTFDSPNYLYLDDVTVEVPYGDSPVVLQTLRLDDGDPETVEIVLDRPLRPGERVTFTFPDPDGPEGPLENVIQYALIGPIPTTSTWSLAALTLLVLTAGTIAIQQPRPAFNT